MPQLFEQFNGVCATLVAVLPPIGEAMRRADAAWPNRLTRISFSAAPGLRRSDEDPLLLCLLQSVPVRKAELELVLTSLRAALLAARAKRLARQRSGVLLRAREAVLHQ